MEGMPADTALNWSQCLKEGLQAIQAQIGPPRKRSRRPASNPTRCRPIDPYVPLVDKLYYSVLARPPRDGTCVLTGDAARAADLGRAFQDAFDGVWQRIPQSDRECLFGYWRDPHAVVVYGCDEPRPPHLPSIQVVEADPDPDEPYACRKFGFELTFPASLVLGQPECLHREISFALAQTLRCATRQHWALVLSMLEEPMARWERRRRGQATEEECDRKWDALLKPYLRAYQQEVTQILRRWGFVDAAADPQAAPRGGKRAAEEA